MLEFLTGATVFRDHDNEVYCVEYQNHKVAECQYKDQAIMLAVDRSRLNELLQEKQLSLP